MSKSKDQAKPHEVREQLPIWAFQARINPDSIDEENRTVEVIWTTGAPVKRYSWRDGVYYMERLSLEAGAIRMERLASGNAPLLDAHWHYQVKDVMGVVRAASHNQSEGRATVFFSRRDDVEPYWQDVRDGVLCNISVGYAVHNYDAVRDENGVLQEMIATDWEPYELSMVPIGADPKAAVRTAGGDEFNVRTFECVIHETNQGDAPSANEERSMPPKDENTNTAGAAPADNATAETRNAPATNCTPAAPAAADNVRQLDDARNQGEQAGVEKERKRVADINAAVRAFGFGQDVADEYIRDGQDINQVRALLQDKMAERSEETGQRAAIRGGAQDEHETRRRLVTNVLAHRASPQLGIELEDGARQYRHLPMLELARVVITEEGGDVRGMAPMELASIATGLQRAPGMMGTSDFPNILGNVVNNRLRQAYERAPDTWKVIARQSNAPDFKERAIVQLSEGPRFAKVNEHGEFRYGSLGEHVEKYSLGTYGVIIPITRQTIINDDLGAFERLPRLLGRAAADNQANIVWDIVKTNPNMGDGTALFHADHGNLAASGGAITVATIGKGRESMRKQKNLAVAGGSDATKSKGEEYLNLSPMHIIVPPELETTADQFVSQNIQPTKASDTNPFQGRLSVVTEARLSGTGGSATAWYLAGDPDVVDIIEFAYLEGEEGVFTEQRIGFEVDGIELKARQDFAAKALDHRNMYKNAGA